MSFISNESRQDGASQPIQTEFHEAGAAADTLPESPLIVIEPGKSWIPIDIRDLWQYRDLLYILTERDVKVRYKQSILGAAWAIIQPLFTMLVFALFFGKFVGVPSDGTPYPLFVYAGLLPWVFFSNALTKSGTSLVGNSNLITKVYFPRMIIPISAVAAGLLDLLISAVFFVVLIVYYGVGFSLNILMLPILILMTAFLAIGAGMLAAALNVKYRDVGHALPFLIQLAFFVSPVIYPASVVPEKWRWLMAFNPVTGIVEGFRAAFLGTAFNWYSAGMSAILTLGVLVVSAYLFRRMEDDFADLV